MKRSSANRLVMKSLAILLVATHVAAASAQTRTSTTAATSAQTAPTQVDNVDRNAAQYWGLTLDDYRRYQTLMKGVRGTLSDERISPIEVLGVHARDDGERRKYAEMFARLMAQDTQRVLQFQVEYEQAFKRLYPQLLALDFGPRSPRQEDARPSLVSTPAQPSVAASLASPIASAMSAPASITGGDRLLVFTRDDCPPCDELVKRATSLVHFGVKVDLYLVGARTDDDARRHARRLALDPALVSARRVTLNVDKGTWTRVLPKQRELPALVRQRGESLVQLAPSDL